MKKLGALLLAVVLLAGCKKDNAVVVKEQATAMGDALLKKDFKTFAKFTYPKVKEMMGGDEKMVANLETGSKQMEAQGYGFVKITVGQPTKIVKAEKELQCTIPQTIVLKVPGGKQTIKSQLIGISSDEGKTWTFIDTGGKNVAEIKAALPNISNDLVLPAREEPVFERDKMR